ncbi:hypothetical protein DL95DRAFT_465056 [Leptodontidium sp. 2 PMI_412]|nr:hypothetical protein DL95DRAFT_465056 [Leptodontidium sp. 2 PMI_412]
MKYRFLDSHLLMTGILWILFLATAPDAAVCAQDNCYRAILATQKAAQASSFCYSFFQTPPAHTATLPAVVQNCGTRTTAISRASSICSCFLPSATTTSKSGSTSSTSSGTSSIQSAGASQYPPASIFYNFRCLSLNHMSSSINITSVSTTTTTETSTTVFTTTITAALPTSCTELLVNNDFDAPEPASTDGHLSVYPWMTQEGALAPGGMNFTFNISTHPVPMSGSALRASLVTGGFKGLAYCKEYILALENNMGSAQGSSISFDKLMT